MDQDPVANTILDCVCRIDDAGQIDHALNATEICERKIVRCIGDLNHPAGDAKAHARVRPRQLLRSRAAATAACPRAKPPSFDCTSACNTILNPAVRNKCTSSSVSYQF